MNESLYAVNLRADGAISEQAQSSRLVELYQVFGVVFAYWRMSVGRSRETSSILFQENIMLRRRFIVVKCYVKYTGNEN
jgi:hypothetical protein